MTGATLANIGDAFSISGTLDASDGGTAGADIDLFQFNINQAAGEYISIESTIVYGCNYTGMGARGTDPANDVPVVPLFDTMGNFLGVVLTGGADAHGAVDMSGSFGFGTNAVILNPPAMPLSAGLLAGVVDSADQTQDGWCMDYVLYTELTYRGACPPSSPRNIDVAENGTNVAATLPTMGNLVVDFNLAPASGVVASTFTLLETDITVTPVTGTGTLAAGTLTDNGNGSWSFEIAGAMGGDQYTIAIGTRTETTCNDTLQMGSFTVDVTAAMPIESLTNCTNAAVCTATPGGAQQGGDLLSYTIPGINHPVADDAADAACFGGATMPATSDLVIEVDVTGFDTIAVSTCNTNPADSSVALYDGDPTMGGMPLEINCTEDSDPMTFCSDTGGVTIPMGVTSVFILVDEWEDGLYWDGMTPRTIDVELFNAPPPMPIETLTDCPMGNCVASMGAGGSTIYTYTIDPLQHPTVDDAEGSCFSTFGGAAANDLIIQVDVTGFSQIGLTTCNTNPGDSSIGIFDGDPAMGGMPMEIACDDDTDGGAGNFCSTIAPGMTPIPMGVTTVFVVIDEYGPGAYWNGTDTRTIDLELVP